MGNLLIHKVLSQLAEANELHWKSICIWAIKESISLQATLYSGLSCGSCVYYIRMLVQLPVTLYVFMNLHIHRLLPVQL